MPKENPIEVGVVFGYLTALGEGSRTGRGIYACRCGKVLEAGKAYVRIGNTTSCGCRRRDTLLRTKTTHGMRGHPLYSTWAEMRRRCYSPKAASFKNYGARGIKVCPSWDSFVKFVSDMGSKPHPKDTLERKDTNADYGPFNCCWASRQAQNENTRASLRYSYRGQTLTMAEVQAKAAVFGIKPGTVRCRISQGMAIERAIELPLQRVGWHPKPTDSRNREGIKLLYPAQST